MLACRGQKTVLGLLELSSRDCEPPHVCWRSNTGPMQEQVLLTAEPSLQPRVEISLNKEFLRYERQLIPLMRTYCKQLQTQITADSEGNIGEYSLQGKIHAPKLRKTLCLQVTP